MAESEDEDMGDWDKDAVPLTQRDVDFLLKETTFDEYEIREWFRAFIKVLKMMMIIVPLLLGLMIIVLYC